MAFAEDTSCILIDITLVCFVIGMGIGEAGPSSQDSCLFVNLEVLVSLLCQFSDLSFYHLSYAFLQLNKWMVSSGEYDLVC